MAESIIDGLSEIEEDIVVFSDSIFSSSPFMFDGIEIVLILKLKNNTNNSSSLPEKLSSALTEPLPVFE